jgi:hypothetical protein
MGERTLVADRTKDSAKNKPALMKLLPWFLVYMVTDEVALRTRNIKKKADQEGRDQ